MNAPATTDAGDAAQADENDAGQALLETIFLGVLVLIPVVYILIAIVRLQATSLAVDHAARDAGRAIDLAASLDSGVRNAIAISRIDLADQGVPAQGLNVTFHGAGSGCTGPERLPSQSAGDVYDICVAVPPHIPGLPDLTALTARSSVRGVYTLHVGAMREGR